MRDVYPIIVACLVLGFASNARKHIQMLELEKDDDSEITYPRFPHKQILWGTGLTFVGLPLALFLYVTIERSFSDHQNFLHVIWGYLTHPSSIVLLILYFFVGAIFACIVYSAMSEHEKKD